MGALSPTRATALALLVLLAATSPARAQVTTSTISGCVADPSGKPIQNAAITVSDDRKAFTRTSTTDGTGCYRVLDVPPATYQVSAAAAGFDTVHLGPVAVAVNSQLRVDFNLTLAAFSQRVEVTAPLLRTEPVSAELGVTLDQLRIEALPLNRRDFLQLAMLTPGVVPPAEGSELSSRSSFAMHANGGREEFNDFLLDGVDNNDPYVRRYVVQPPVDSIQEFKIATNGYGAEFGKGAAGQVNVVTRSGSNRFDMTAYEYFRNEALNARNAFDASGAEPGFDRNQFGVAAGLPISRNHTFLFFNVDALRERRTVARLATVPTDRQRTGDLSELSAAVVDPFTRRAFAGNVIPAGRIDPLAQNVLALFPRANLPGLGGNYLFDAPFREDQDQVVVRLDQVLPHGGQLAVRYNYGLVDAFDPYAEDSDTVAGFGNAYHDPAHNALVQYQRAVGRRAVSTTRLGFNQYSRDILAEQSGTDVGQMWGVNWLQLAQRDLGYPKITVAGFSSVGDATNLPLARTTTTFHASENVTLDRGRHTWRFGGELRHQKLDGNLDMFARGSLSFSGALSGAGIGDLLLGLPSFGLRATADNTLRLRTTQYSAYAQDSWRIRRDVTVDLGLRYQYGTPPADPTNHMSTFDAATGKVYPVGTAGIPAAGMRPDTNNIAPRVGIAWNAKPNLVVRAGYGVYYDTGMFEVSSAQYFNPPQFTLRVYFPTQYSLLTLANPFPAGGGYTPPASLSTLSPDLVTSWMQHWNVSVNRQFGWLGSATISYAGSTGSSLVRPRDLNQPRPGPGDIQPRRPYPAFGSIFYIESEGRSDFHSLQLALSRPLSGNLGWSAAYTWSRSMDDASAFLGTTGDPNFPQDSLDLAAQWGSSNFDVRHRLSAAFIYRLPWEHVMLRDTELRGIVTLQSGAPFTPRLRFDNSNTGNTGQQSGSDHPNVVGSAEVSNPTKDRWFDTAAFAVAPRYTFGDAGRNILRGPGYCSLDVSLARRIRFGAQGWLTLEAQAFNVLNTVNYNLPELYVDEPTTFGRIFSAKAPRQVQLAVRVGF